MPNIYQAIRIAGLATLYSIRALDKVGLVCDQNGAPEPTDLMQLFCCGMEIRCEGLEYYGDLKPAII